MILLEIQKIRGMPVSPEKDMPSGTREIGVMCELIPSPPTARYASSLGLDRSARRYHSVLSRPLSPEPRPTRRKSRRHLLTRAKVRNSNKQHILRGLHGKKYGKNFCGEVPEMDSNIKTEKDMENRLRKDYKMSLEQTSDVDIIFRDLKSDPESDRTIIVSELTDSESADNIKSLVVSKSEENDLMVSSVTREVVLKSVDSQGLELKECEILEGSSNKETISLGDTACLNQLQGKEEEREDEEDEEEEDMDMEEETDKMICDPEVIMAERQEGDVPKRHLAEEIKYKFSCIICSYKSMRENHFLKHMRLHDKVSDARTITVYLSHY